MIKNISKGVVLSGLLVAVYPLIAATFTYLSSMMTGYGLNSEWNNGLLALVFTIPVGIVITLIGLVLQFIFPKFTKSGVTQDEKTNFVVVLLTAVAITVVVLFVAKIIPGTPAVPCTETTDIRSKCR